MGRLQATCGARRSAVPCKQLRAFTSVCMQLRAFASVFERARSRFVAFRRVWSRLVAFSRANFFFRVWTRSGTFGRVLSSFFVIFRHSSSQNGFFGYGGQRAVAAPAGQGGQQFAAHGSRAGRGMCKMAWYSFEIGMQLRHGRGCVRLYFAQLYYKIGAFAVAGNPRVHLRMGVGLRVALKGRTPGSCLSCGSGSQYAGDS